jgi:hypothetical protein
VPCEAPQERSMVRLDGIEPSTPAWKAEVLPLNYSRAAGIELRGRSGAVKPPLQLPPVGVLTHERFWRVFTSCFKK